MESLLFRYKKCCLKCWQKTVGRFLPPSRKQTESKWLNYWVEPSLRRHNYVMVTWYAQWWNNYADLCFYLLYKMLWITIFQRHILASFMCETKWDAWQNYVKWSPLSGCRFLIIVIRKLEDIRCADVIYVYINNATYAVRTDCLKMRYPIVLKHTICSK